MRLDTWLNYDWTVDVYTTNSVLDSEWVFQESRAVFWRSTGEKDMLIYSVTPIPLLSQLRNLRTPDGQIAFPVRAGLAAAVSRVNHVEPTLDPWGRVLVWEHVARRI